MHDEEFDALVAENGKRLSAFAFRLAGNREDAEEIVQSTFLNALRAWKSFEGRSSGTTWLLRIAVRVSQRILERRSREPRAVVEDHEPGHAPGDPLEAREEAEAVRRTLLELQPIHRLVLTLFAVEGLSHKEIAAVLECPEGTVWSRLHQAKRAFGERFERNTRDPRGTTHDSLVRWRSTRHGT